MRLLKKAYHKIKISDITNLATNTTLYAKIIEDEGEIPNMTNLTTTTTTTAFTAIENKIPDISNLIKKLTITRKLVKLKVKLLLIMIMIIILRLKNLISTHRKIILQDWKKKI